METPRRPTSENDREPPVRRTTLAAMLAVSASTTPAATIGFVTPLSGPRAPGGQDRYHGFMLALEQPGGKPASVVEEDDRLEPTSASGACGCGSIATRSMRSSGA